VTLRLPGRRSIELRTYPASDPTFGAEVRAALIAAGALASEPDVIASMVVDRLRATYRHVVLVEQDELARVVPNVTTWYLYRDGRILLESKDRERGPEGEPSGGETSPGDLPVGDRSPVEA
jgi:hypothetical protein